MGWPMCNGRRIEEAGIDLFFYSRTFDFRGSGKQLQETPEKAGVWEINGSSFLTSDIMAQRNL